MNISRLALMGVGTAAMCSFASAQLTGNLLLRQAGAGNQVNQVFGDFPTYSSGMGSLVTVTGAGWNISNIQTWQIGNAGNTWFGNVNQAYLNVTRQVSGAPDAAIDPTTTNSGANVIYSGLISVVLDNPLTGNETFRIVGNTGSITQLQGLAAGNYVFSMAPLADFGTRGQTFTATAAVTGSADDYIRNPGGSFAFASGANWGTLSANFGSAAGTQWAIGINGSPVPEPASMAVLGVGALALIRRRRSKKS